MTAVDSPFWQYFDKPFLAGVTVSSAARSVAFRPEFQSIARTLAPNCRRRLIRFTC
jgi:hypothetical protein